MVRLDVQYNYIKFLLSLFLLGTVLRNILRNTFVRNVGGRRQMRDK